MTDVRIHMCFDPAHDRDLHDRLLAQSRGRSAFAISSRSEGGELTEEWIARVRGRITDCDEVLVICGEHTDESSHVSVELQIAQEQHKPYVLVWGRRDSMCKKPKSAKADDGMYSWTREILEHQITYELRRSREREVPESLKRQVPVPREAPPA
jgi:Thoeris protein ThsB, TIR-like domain